MRRLSAPPRDDRGVVTLLVIGLMTALLLASAAAIDVNRYSQENSSAQHSADATAMAVATDCVRTGAPLSLSSYEMYRRDGQVISPATPVACGAGTVRIGIEKDVDAGLLLNDDARTVHKEATVRWGTLSSATTAPVVISQCTFDLATAGGTTFPSAEVIIPLGAGGPTCPGRPPGAFGWLDTGLAGPCSVTTTLNASGQLVVHGNTGNGNVNPWDCITQVGLNGTITIPVYGASCGAASPCAAGQDDGNGTNNYYLILGFAEIQVTGWNLQHGAPTRSPTSGYPACPGPGSASCLRGRFVRFATQLGSSGPGTDFGVQQIFLSS